MKVIGKQGYIGSALHLPDLPGTLLVAGHSSVKMCENDPDGAWTNNVEFFRDVLRNCEKPLIYASSGSVYEGTGREDQLLKPRGVYDLTKITIDNIAEQSGEWVYGLRLATVCGWSPNLRVDVMLNKMVFDAKTQGEITVQNPDLPRPILGMRDLNRAIVHILKTHPPGGIYNLASFNSTVGEMAQAVSEKFEVPIVEKEGSSPYAMSIDTSKIESTGFEFEDTLDSILTELAQPWESIGVRE